MAVLAASLLPVLPAAAANLTIVYTNNTSLELIEIDAYLETAGEMRRNRSRVNLPGGGQYQIGVNGAIKPLRIRMEVATGRLDFADLSGLDMREVMQLAVVRDKDGFRLEQNAGPGNAPYRAQGEFIRFLTDSNAPNAASKEAVTRAKTLDEVRGVVEEAVAKAAESRKSEHFDAPAGPIFNNDHAQERCPQVLEEWLKANNKQPDEAYWTGNWATTKPNHSVCGFASGPAPLAATLFEEDEGKMLLFPVAWAGSIGLGRAASSGESSPGISVALRMDLQKSGGPKRFLEDLKDSGYRPWRAELSVWEGDSENFNYEKSPKSANQDWAGLLPKLEAARDNKTPHVFTCMLLHEKTFQEAAAAKDVAPAPAVMVFCGYGNLEAIFIPDCSLMF